MDIKIKLLSDNAVIPNYKTIFSSGADVFAVEDDILLPKEVKLIRTGLAVDIPIGFEIQIRGKNGLSQCGIMLGNGVGTVDSDYRGEIGVLLSNTTEDKFLIPQGSSIAQFVISNVEHGKFIEVSNLDETIRTTDLFGESAVE